MVLSTTTIPWGQSSWVRRDIEGMSTILIRGFVGVSREDEDSILIENRSHSINIRSIDMMYSDTIMRRQILQ